MPNVVIIRPDQIGNRPRKMATSLSKYGFNVLVLGWDRKRTLKCPNTIERKKHFLIQRLKLKAPEHRPFRLAPLLPVYWLWLFTKLLLSNVDVIHVSYVYSLPPVLLVKFLKGSKVVYDISDFSGLMLPPSWLLSKILHKFEMFVLHFTDAVIFPNEKMASVSKNMSLKRVTVIMNTPEDIRTDNSFKRIGNSKDFVLFLGGGIWIDRGINQIIKAINGLNHVKFKVSGWGDKRIISALCRAPNIEYLGKLPYFQYLNQILESNACIILYDPLIPNNRFASPNKLFDAMMCGIPVIVNETTYMSELVTKERCGIVVSYSNGKKIREAIIFFKKNLNLAAELGRNGRKAFVTKYNWKIMEKKLLYIYKELISNS